MIKLSNIRRKAREDRGAALVEFAVVAPLLLTLLLGMVEAGWAFNNQLDTTHAAREAGRLAAVNAAPAGAGTQGENIIAEVCSRIDAPGDVEITLTRSGSQIGGELTVLVEHDYQPITGGFIPFFNNVTLTSTASMRLEQTATWGATGPESCGP